jgi:phage head maturation protease
VTGSSNFRNSVDLNGNDLVGAGDITASGSVSGTLNSTGDLDMNNNDINNVVGINASGTIVGTIDAAGGHNSDITVKGSTGADCVINISHGVITGTTCP